MATPSLLGRITVTVYRRHAPSGNPAFMVANYANDTRRFDSSRTKPPLLKQRTNSPAN
jgi:hypothetical protein